MKYLLTSIALILTGLTFAQDVGNLIYSGGTYYDGYVIEADGTQKHGFIRYSDPYSIQSDVEFYTDKEDRKSKVKYKADDLSEYQVGELTFHVIHYSGGLFSKPVKGNLLQANGCISEYLWFGRAENYLTMTKLPSESDLDYRNRKYPPTNLYKRKDLEDVHETSYFALKFTDKMAEFVGDNKELAEKVTNKEKGYKMLNMLEIIAEYNEQCEK